ncbi:MAG TPA: ATP-binding cassette domain-containing protein [Caldimonas sp.]|nr:ATP-binding cassette domain-containing protein [Caldimonas sp.]
MIDVREAAVSFGGVKALDNVSITCSLGQIVGVVGPSGAGKSTLFDAISGRHPLVSGSISIGGATIDGMAPQVVARRGLARTYQEDRLFTSMTVLDNVFAGAHLVGAMHSEALARSVLESLGLRDRANAHVWELAPGERRRVALARAIASSAKALVLDEPLRSLDESELEVVRTVLRGIANESGGRAILISDRDVDAIAGLCDRVVALHAGKAIAHGTFDEVVRDVDVRDAYLGVEWRQ